MRLLIPVVISLVIGSLPDTSFSAVVDSATANAEMSLTSKTLKEMESPAEDMLDSIAVKDIKMLSQQFKEVTSIMDKLNQLNAAAIPDTQSKNIALQNSWFDLISLEMKEMDDIPALAYAINQFSGQLIIAADFNHEYEKNVAWMDYLGREILLLNKYPNSNSPASLIKTRKNDLERTWVSLKVPLAKSQQGLAVIQQVDPVMLNIMAEDRPDRLVALAEQELEIVDKIEVFFHMD
jgi:hypothetical protein